ncbi:MAG: class I SAM-dependent methyltransferase [Syntrophaceae bacterium]|nr:class I SAM-dependent methyltransferase [Syntrophaceae bacterium]
MQKLGVPQKSEMLNVMINILRFKKTKPRLLEIGCGLGGFSRMILKKYPEASFVFLDGSPEMIVNVKKRLSTHKCNVTFLQRDINCGDWFDDMNGLFDAVVSSWCLHYLSDKRRKPFFKEIHQLLRPSGIFIYSCSIQPETNRLLRLYNDLEISRIKQSLTKLGMAITDSQIKAMADEGHRKARINPAYIDEYLKIMKRAGFASSGCVWKYLFNAVFLAHKGK